MLPVIKELHKCLVREEGEQDPADDYIEIESSDDEESDEILPNVQILDETRGLNIQENERSGIQRIGQITVSQKIKRSNKIDCRNMLGFMNQNLYHDYLNITNIMKLKRLDFRDVYSIRCSDLMITRENLIERIMILITSYF